MREPIVPFQGQRIEKPWGYELIWAKTDRYAGKILHIEAGEALSLQYHERKDETLCLLTGEVRIEIGDAGEALQTMSLRSGESLRLPPGRRHRLTAVVTSDILEASTPELDDVIRLEDRYGRAK